MSVAPAIENGPIVNAMTVDVEEHFQVSAFEPVVKRSDWDALPSRVEDNTRRMLDLLDQHRVARRGADLEAGADGADGGVIGLRVVAGRGQDSLIFLVLGADRAVQRLELGAQAARLLADEGAGAGHGDARRRVQRHRLPRCGG